MLLGNAAQILLFLQSMNFRRVGKFFF